MEPLIALLAILVVGSSIWVGIDAWSIGARKGLLPGIVDLGPVGWFFACLGIWVLAFPLYLANRGDIAKAVIAKDAASPAGVARGQSGVVAPIPSIASPGVQSPYEQLAGDAAESAHSGPKYKVKLAAGEFGPFALERLQEFVSTGQLRPDSIVLPEFGQPIAARDVQGLEFPPGATAGSVDNTDTPEAAVDHPDQVPVPTPRAGSNALPGPASAAIKFEQVATVATQPQSQAASDRPQTTPAATPPTDATAVPGTPPPSGGGFPPSPYRKADSGGTGAGMGVVALLVLIAGLQVLGMVLRHTVQGPRGRWEHKVSSASDQKFDSHFDELGKEGWQIVTCRRAMASSGSTREYRYECALKRRASISSD